LIARLFPQIRQFCYYGRSLVRRGGNLSIDFLFQSFEAVSSSQMKCLGFDKTEFKLIVSKAFNIKLFMYELSAIYHVAFAIISICKVEGLNI